MDGENQKPKQSLIGWPQSAYQKFTSVVSNRKLMFILLFAVIGSAFILYSRAETPNVSFEAEDSSVTGNASVISDSAASGGKALVLNGGSGSSGTSYRIKTWAPQFQGFGTVGTASDFHPEKFDLVIGNHNIKINGMSIADSVSYLRSKGIPVFIYLNGSFKNKQDLGPNGNDPTFKSDYPDSSYAHTSGGSRITENDFGGNYLMNPLDSTWRNSLWKKCNYRFSLASYDGCFFDTIGTAPVSASYVSPGVPINPTTGQAWTDSSWLDAMNANVNNAKPHLSGKKLYGNLPISE